MTSYDIYYRLGKIDTDISYLKQGQAELKHEINNVRTELKADINNVRTELKADINNVRTELKNDINSVRNELKNDINSVRTESKADINGVKTEIRELRAEIQDVRNDFTNQISNLRVEILTGLGIGVAVISCIIALAIFKVSHRQSDSHEVETSEPQNNYFNVDLRPLIELFKSKKGV